MKGEARMIDERELEYLKPYSKLYENVLHINKAMERQEWKTAAKYCRDALAEMVVQDILEVFLRTGRKNIMG